MIRLNDYDKTVIDESKVVAYYGYGEEKINIVLSNNLYVEYNSQEARDKDIELLDKLLDVKSIEYKAMSVEKPTGYVNGMKEECEPVKEEYLAWEEVKNSKKKIKVKMPNGDIKFIYYDDNDIVIASNIHRQARIYEGELDLFNALMLKKVE